MNHIKQRAALQYSEVLWSIYRLYSNPVKAPRTASQIKAEKKVVITEATISRLVKEGVLVKVARATYKLGMPRKHIERKALALSEFD